MTKHILIIDPLEKLVIKKDSSLQLALTLQQLGQEVFVTFKKYVYFQNNMSPNIQVFTFHGEFSKDSYYLSKFELNESSKTLKLDSQCVLHMRLDPPFNLEYLRTLWILQSLKMYDVKVINDSRGILLNNEKLFAYTESKYKVPSFLGLSDDSLNKFLLDLKSKNIDQVVLKPVDLFQGEGVVKIPLQESLVLKKFNEMKSQFHGAIVVQPYIDSVEQGEIRAVFFDSVELGSIIKIPPAGAFLANIAQGATFKAIDLKTKIKDECIRICKLLEKDGVRWAAFDILGDMISEVNITCPGLLVECSQAHKKNLALDIVDAL